MTREKFPSSFASCLSTWSSKITTFSNINHDKTFTCVNLISGNIVSLFLFLFYKYFFYFYLHKSVFEEPWKSFYFEFPTSHTQFQLNAQSERISCKFSIAFFELSCFGIHWELRCYHKMQFLMHYWDLIMRWDFCGVRLIERANWEVKNFCMKMMKFWTNFCTFKCTTISTFDGFKL